MKIYKPTTQSRRHMTGINYREFLTTSTPVKSLVFGGKRSVGRNNYGRITVRHQGGGEKRYVLLPHGVKVGSTFIVSDKAPVLPANRLPLKAIPVDTFVYNVALRPGGPALLARSAGNAAKVKAQEGNYTFVELPSTEVRKVINTAWASIGAVSNEENHLVVIGKAGRSRWLGVRPTVRGSAQNP